MTTETPQSLATQTPTPSPTPTPEPTPAPSPTPASEFKPDPGKTDAENATAKAAFDAEAAKSKEPAKPEPTAEEKAAAEAKAKLAVSKDNPFKPEELKLPEGLTLDEGLSKGFVELVNKHSIPRDVAAELVKLQTDAMKAASEKSDTQWSELQTKWQNDIKADKDFGGDKLATNQSGIGHLLTKYGDADVRAAFDLTGAGNHPAIFRFLSKMAADLVEPGARSPSIPPSQSLQDVASKMYPNQGKAA
jgi:hypothetical protein